MQNKLGARCGHNDDCRDRMEKALEEDGTGDGKDRSNLQKEKMDQYVAAEGETLLNKGDAESKNEHGNSRHNVDSNTREGNVNEDKMDDAEDLECASGSSSDICIATPATLSRPEIIIDAPDGRAETRVHTTGAEETDEETKHGCAIRGARSQGQDRG